MHTSPFGIATTNPVRSEVQLAPFTTWRIGGPARWFWEPTADEVPRMLERCHRLGVRTYYLGRGSNTLIADDGLDGLVICTRRSLREIHRRGDTVVAEAGVPLPALSKFVADLGHGGFEFLIGIPGTVGAGVAINAGLTAHEVRDVAGVLVSADVCGSTGTVRTAPVRDLALGYRTSAALTKHAYVLRATFRLASPSSAESIRAATAAHLRERRRKQPLSKATAGSTFKQPHGGRSAGWYLDEAGLKGAQIGGARVSHKHANWIENVGNAEALHVMELMEHMRSRVREAYGVDLEREVRFLPRDADRG